MIEDRGYLEIGGATVWYDTVKFWRSVQRQYRDILGPDAFKEEIEKAQNERR